MNTKRVLSILKKDVQVSPRSPLVLFALVLPVALTGVLHLVFGSSFNAPPDLAYVDHGSSQIVQALRDSEAVGLHELDDEAELRERVGSGSFDAGLMLPEDFDEQVRSGERPQLQLYISGESYATDRLVVSVSTIDAVREISGSNPPLSVETVDLGNDDHVPLATRFVPVVAMYAFLIAGLFVPAASIVDERERGTLTAVTVTPASLSDLLAAKLLFGMVLTIIMTLVTLGLNDAFGSSLSTMVLVIVLTSAFWSLLGLIVGLLSKNSQTLFAVVKGSGALLMAPVVFYLFPDWPQWIASLFPTYWAIDPLWQIMTNDAGFADVRASLAVVLGLSAALALVVAALARKLGAGGRV
ncbi:MAG: ABC transporter permease [bacterium]